MILVRRWRNDNLTAYWDFLPKQLLTRDTFNEADLDLLQSKHMACPAPGLAPMLPPVCSHNCSQPAALHADFCIEHDMNLCMLVLPTKYTWRWR